MVVGLGQGIEHRVEGIRPRATAAMRAGTPPQQLRTDLSDADYQALVMFAHAWLVSEDTAYTYWSEQVVRYTAAYVPLPWTPAEVESMLDATAFTRVPWGLAYLMPVAAARALDESDLATVSERFRWILERLQRQRSVTDPDDRLALMAMIPQLLQRARPWLDPLPRSLLNPGADLDPAAGEALRALLRGPGVDELLRHCERQTKVEPSGRWLAEARRLTAASPQGRAAVTALLKLFCDLDERTETSMGFLAEDTETILRGIVWLPSEDADDVALLADVAIAASTPFTGQPGFPRAPRLARSAVTVLGRRGGDVGLTTLARLAVTVRSKALLSRVHAALGELGALRGWSLPQVLEMAVDTHGLDISRRLSTTVGAYEATIEIVGEKVRLGFRRDGKALKGVPAGVAHDHGDALREQKKLVKEIGATLSRERQRVEGLLSTDREWPWPDWEQRYLEHPVTGVFGRELVWEAATATGWQAGLPLREPSGWVLAGRDGEAIRGDRVRLWHPLRAEVDEVRAWRDHLMAAERRQPFKQAFREVYLLTPAEEATRGYSNRFAGHILRYRQANALMRTRGWSATYLGTWDGGYESQAMKEFGDNAWRASFYHDLVPNAERTDWEVRHCSTDQVRFARRDGAIWTETPLTEVPPNVFSEAMRDVDLFVGVTSIAADPAWLDRGDDRFTVYWHTTSFGDLTASGQVRRDALERLLPRLKIADRVELTDKFLRVRGKLRTYKIHLGSANILMEPNDAYLCIVAGRGDKTGALHLPFEEDHLLSLILSKALLLAADDKITDSSITSQISGRL